MNIKKLVGAVAMMVAMTLGAVQIQNYDSGTYTNMFQSAPAAVFDFTNSVGIAGSRALIPTNPAGNSLNFLTKGPFQLSSNATVLSMSTMFQIQPPTGSLSNCVQLGFFDGLGATGFQSPGTNSGITAWILPSGIIPVNGAYQFDLMVFTPKYNGTTSTNALIDGDFLFGFQTSTWYQAILTVTRTGTNTVSVLAAISDGSTNEMGLPINLATVNTGPITNTAMANAPLLFPALNGSIAGGLAVLDKTIITGNLSGAAEDICIVQTVTVSFGTESGRSYYLQSSPDLSQWDVTAGPVYGTGATVDFIFPTTNTSQYFRVSH